mmetsp:Transcript_17908/g.41088  ORF Transcript_17908/g.41088 Transcript_17908/m.41088 type:complete len:287 (-) Transcript_17908:47-907(-)
MALLRGTVQETRSFVLAWKGRNVTHVGPSHPGVCVGDHSLLEFVELGHAALQEFVWVPFGRWVGGEHTIVAIAIAITIAITITITITIAMTNAVAVAVAVGISRLFRLFLIASLLGVRHLGTGQRVVSVCAVIGGSPEVSKALDVFMFMFILWLGSGAQSDPALVVVSAIVRGLRLLPLRGRLSPLLTGDSLPFLSPLPLAQVSVSRSLLHPCPFGPGNGIRVKECCRVCFCFCFCSCVCFTVRRYHEERQSKNKAPAKKLTEHDWLRERVAAASSRRVVALLPRS